jgi:hypothetical protein
MTRFRAAVGVWGGWVVEDYSLPHVPPLPAVVYARRSLADKYADLLNAVHEQEPREVVDRIRADLDALRTDDK